MIIQVIIDASYYKFIDTGDLNKRSGAVSSDNFETFQAPVEKYLSDSAALSAVNKAYTSYHTQNKDITARYLRGCFKTSD